MAWICIHDYVFSVSFLSDIAKVSVEQCEERYKELKKTHETRRYRDPLFQPEFITADCTKVTYLLAFFTHTGT